ncbi:MAG: glycyl-radical enzyme activating protein [Candidatus Omnitrophota bacterium]|jgi:pyruvate formate lyase activating enzyme|nr:MAG: glycyl-radical enzyme activating protein [Candidatus Omnitrophota bacterium]
MVEGIIFDIKRYAVHDGPGIRTTVFLQGCPLKCWWCHNPEGLRDWPNETFVKQSYAKSIGRVSVETIIQEIEKDLLFYEESGGGVTFSGGEPLVQHEFLRQSLAECKRRGIHTALDTTGYAPADIVQSIANAVDLFLYDLKLMDGELHEKYTGVSNSLIHENVKMLTANGNAMIVRVPLIPRITDTDDNLERLAEFVRELNGVNTIHFLPYHQTASQKYRRLQIENKMTDIHPPSEDEVNAVKNRFEKQGFLVKIGG